MNQQYQQKQDKPAKPFPSFTIDERITVYLDFNLACEIGNHILDNPSDNPAIMAFAKRLANMSPND